MAFDITSYVLGKKSAGGGGGGGSSDWTTATVTVTNNYASAVNLNQCICCVNEGEVGEGSPAMVSDISEVFGPLEHGTTETYRVPLYKGACLWIVTADGTTINTTGDISNIYGPMYLISGDGTITIS